MNPMNQSEQALCNLFAEFWNLWEQLPDAKRNRSIYFNVNNARGTIQALPGGHSERELARMRDQVRVWISEAKRDMA